MERAEQSHGRRSNSLLPHRPRQFCTGCVSGGSASQTRTSRLESGKGLDGADPPRQYVEGSSTFKPIQRPSGSPERWLRPRPNARSLPCNRVLA
ncbi:MAG: hypothetical protein ACUBOA_01790 [Candidatus Loosdrechtia sp.]|uniref:hypothetical protein n=1 Tax=Candidatus Loosdrechtia sp. TaxID=3101272 RepID=UPI003A69F920|nr:MAG: hypothetical protein QY305_06890 [Candidatus Jettenia sp. AMX2]